MRQENYTAFINGKLTPIHAMEDMITSVGSGLYAYMVMLRISGRESEATFFEDIRNRIFAIRSKIYTSTEETLKSISEEMRIIYAELSVAETFIRIHKPEEATILQSPVNEACGLIRYIKDFKA